MRIVQWRPDAVQALGEMPVERSTDGFLWIDLPRSDLGASLAQIQELAQTHGGAQLLDLHVRDLASAEQPSSYDTTSSYDLVVFRCLVGAAQDTTGNAPGTSLLAASQAVGFVVFDDLLISVHPGDKPLADDALVVLQGVSQAMPASRLRQAVSPADLALRLIGTMVEDDLQLGRHTAQALQVTETRLLTNSAGKQIWADLITTRARLRLLHELCEDQQDAMEEWLEALREQPPPSHAVDTTHARRRQDTLVARARDVHNHIERVRRQIRRLEQSTETALQIHWGAQGERTNNILLTLTAITVVFLPLNLLTSFFGMNFDALPLIHSTTGMWLTLVTMVVLAVAIMVVFWRKHYLVVERKRGRQRQE